jgi:bifunctional UDP-N-acetylglucosamine pyrophosphorylase/glucosamine-1-phosphate N-acetyltransferase
MNKVKAVILAAGKGTRMKSDLPKVLHEVKGITMVEHVIEAAKRAGATDICLVIGHGGDLVKNIVGPGVTYVEQTEQLGTGHAVKCARDFVGQDGDTLVLCGDTPLLRGDTLAELISYHKNEGHMATVLSTILEDSTGYGRIVRDAKGNFVKNVEQKDASDIEREVKEINSGVYVFNSKALYESLDLLKNENVQGEYYLPDTLTIIKNSNEKAVVEAWVTEDYDEIRGVNTPEQLAEAEEILSAR